MRSEDVNCRTCGAEYKNNPIILIVVALLFFVGLLLAVYLFFSKSTMAPVNEGIKSDPVKSLNTNWVMEEDTDKMTDKKNFYLFNRALNVDTGKSVDAGITIGCSLNGGLNGVFTSDKPIKTKNFNKDGAEGEYSIRFDDKPMESGSSTLTSINRVFVLNNNHLQQVESSSRVLIRITTGIDESRTFEINSVGGADLFTKMRELCLSRAKDNKAP
ncbi:hypothetical protein [Acinetobacter gyllenbergii]|uniref:hypothetical protein n=1 Tax=Acinetobacter gyllenbergii TaxID=134534 RepID=UPI0011476D41|nr:hypothetical protein [Acinetobacter gyllenbergii]